MMYITGDIHGHIDLARLMSENWPVGQTLTRLDYLVILGDFGLDINWNNKRPKWFKWLNKQPWTTLFVDGNHDDIPFLNGLPKMEMFNGIVGVAADNIFHLRRGEVYKIGWPSFFVMGGATSIDKDIRIPDKTWFSQEIPDRKDWDNAIKNLEPYGGKVDNVLAHTMPYNIAEIYLNINLGTSLKNNLLEKDFQNFINTDNLKFNNWYCGHWHPKDRWDHEKYHCLYHYIEQIQICSKDINRKL